MSASLISPVAPARIPALLLPMGKIKRSKYDGFRQRLLSENVVHLGDISPDVGPKRDTFSPLAFPSGKIFFQWMTSTKDFTQLSVWPFETFRDPLVILGIADASEYILPGDVPPSLHSQSKINLAGKCEELVADLSATSASFSRSLIVKLLLFDLPPIDASEISLSNVVVVPPMENSRSTTMKTIVCDIAALLLHAASEYSGKITTMNLGGNFRSLESSFPRSASGNDVNSRPSSAPSTSRSESHASSAEPSAHSSAADLASQVKRTDSIRPMSRNSKFRPNDVSASSTEIEQSRTKHRQGIVVGALHLQTGQWSYALKETVDNTTRAKALLDHLWHAKGLENIIVAMILLAWSGVDFQIPGICNTNSERSTSRKNETSSIALDIRASGDLETRARTLSNLSHALPELARVIADLYARVDRLSAESIPNLVFTGVITRLGVLLASLRSSGGTLNQESLNFLVTGTTSSRSSKQPPFSLISTRSELATYLMRAFPTNAAAGPVSAAFENVVTLSGIASVLSFAGMHRKRALVDRELLAVLIPALIQARKVGAAEAGIHPAAGLASFHDPREFSSSASSALVDTARLANLVIMLTKTFGVNFGASHSRGDAKGWSMESLQREAFDEAVLQEFGGLPLKVAILRLCSHFAEALPDYATAMKLNAQLLRLAKPMSSPADGRLQRNLWMSSEEQIRLGNKIYRKFGLQDAAASTNLEARYWDPFIVRGLELRTQAENLRLNTINSSKIVSLRDELAAPIHRRSEGPFIHNPFAAVELKPLVDTIVAGEGAAFYVMLQNPYEIDLIIEKLQLITEGTRVDQESVSAVLGPCTIQKVAVSVIPASAGKLSIIGCTIKVQSCHEAAFLIFDGVWRANVEFKIKHSGLQTSWDGQQGSSSINTAGRPEIGSILMPGTSFDFVVAAEQPRLRLVSTSLSRSTLTILQGEYSSFSVSVENISATTEVNLFNLTFNPAGVTGLDSRPQTAESQGKAPSFMVWKDAKSESRVPLKPMSTKSFEVAFEGAPEVKEVIVHIDYAQLADPANPPPSIQMRRLSVPILVVVDESISLINTEVFPGSFEEHGFGDIATLSGPTATFVLSLQLMNGSARPLNYEFSCDNENVGTPTSGMLQPGQSTRVTLYLPKLSSEDIRAFDNTRDAIVSQVDMVQACLRHQLKGTWSDLAGTRTGNIDLSNISLNTRDIALICKPSISTSFQITDNGEPADVVKIGPNEFKVKMDASILMTTTVFNHTNAKIQPVVRYRPRFCIPDERSHLHTHSMGGETAGVDLMSRDFAWTGSLLTKTDELDPGHSIDLQIGLCIFTLGRFEVAVHIEDATIPESPAGLAQGLQPQEVSCRSRCSIIVDL